MTLNNYFTIPTHDLDDRPKPKVWLLKPDYTRIERLSGVSKLIGSFKANNLNTLTGQISPTIFDSVTHKQKRNPVFDLIKNKYLIEFHYNGFKDYFVIDEVKNVSTDSDNITFTAESVSTELNKKAANELEMLGSTIRNIMNKTCVSYAPLWSVDYVDAKLADIKRELTLTNSTVMGIIDEVNKQFDSVVVFNNKDRKMSFYHKDNVGVNRGLRIRENSYLKSFEDTIASKDIITRLYPFGNSGLTIQSVNPSGTDYIEDFSYFIAPFKRDAHKKVLQHSDYMSDALCHSLLDYQDYYDSKKDEAEKFTKRYTDILKEYTQESFTLNQLKANLQRLQDRVEVLKPKSEYIDLGTHNSTFDFYTPKSSYYLLMLKNDGTLANITYGGQSYTVPTNDWLYLKIDTGDFKDGRKFEEKIKHTLQITSARTSLRAILTRSSKVDFEESEDKHIDEKYNLIKYEDLVRDQAKVVATIEKRMKIYEDEKASLIQSMSPKVFLSEELYNERESYIFSGIWSEENHTDAKELYEDAIKQMKKQKELNRSVTVGLVNFTQSLEHKRDWDKLNVGDVIVFSNKIFNKKLKAYITDIQMNFEDNQVTLTISDIIDYVDESRKVAELIATASSTSTAVNFHKEQIKKQQGKMTAMSQLIEAEWDANKKRIMAGNETVDIGAHGIKVVSNENPDEFVAIVGGVIALTRDGGNTFKTGINPEGVNAETLIGKIFIGENLELQNESGSVKFNKDGFFADVSAFTLTTNDGKENYFDKLKNEMREDSKTELDRLKESLLFTINKAMEEANDVESVVDKAITDFEEAFKDGVISDVEKKMINETLSQLEKENSEYVEEIDKALSSPYISNEDIILLNDKRQTYTFQYETLVEDVNLSISDAIITKEESERIHTEIIQFRANIQEMMSLLKEILNRNLENQIKQVQVEAQSYTDRMKADIKDELDDLKQAMDKTKDTIDKAMKDNVFDAVEIENIKTVLMILKSEQDDVINRFTSLFNNESLPEEIKTTLLQKKNNLVSKYDEFSKYVNEMIKDGISDDTEKVNYNLKFNNLSQAQTEFFTEYDRSVIAIANKYTDTREGHLTERIEGLQEEFKNDIQDVKDNMSELQTTLNETFKDGIVSETELTRLKMHLDMLDREYLDIDERYKELSVNSFLPEANKLALGQARTPYANAHTDLRKTITTVISDKKVDTAEKNAVDTRISTYNRTLAAFSKAIQTALNMVARNIASDIADEKVREFNPILESLNTNLSAIQKQVDNAIDTYYYGYDPTLTNVPSSNWADNKTKEQHVGDLFLNTKTGIAYRFLKNGSVYQWQRIEDQAISDALNRAQGAMDLADNKRRVFVATPKPPYDVGDLWMQGKAGDAMVCFTAKTASQVYSANDWVKAVKYTDDSKANQVLEQLNTFKDSTSTDLNRLKADANKFKQDVKVAYEDKIISATEASTIKSRFYSVLDVKKRLENKYFTLSQNSDLIGKPKNALVTSYNSMNTAYTSLESVINSAITDNKISEAETTNTNKAFDTFITSIQNLEKAFDEAFTAIVTNIASSKAREVQERFDEWKNSEFTTTSEKIVQRVSEAKWRDTYFPEVTNKINNIQVGGRNLIQNYNSNQSAVSGDKLGDYSVVLQAGKNINFYFYDRPPNLNEQLEPNTDYVLQIHESDKDVKIGVFYNKGTNSIVPYTTERIIKFNTTDKKDIRIVIVAQENDTNIGKVSLYKSNVLEDWSPAPEDIDNKLVEQGTKINSASSYIEQNKEKIKNSVSKTDVEGQFSKLTTNQNSYTVNNNQGNILTEFYGTPFSDTYTYEVTAKNTTMANDNVASAIFVSKGANRGFDLVELENKGTTGTNPRFLLNAQGKPCISVYTASGNQKVEVIYSKYMGSTSSLKTTKSLIEQKADEISLKVEKLKDEKESNNLLHNSDFDSGFDGWSFVESDFTITDTAERAFSIGENLVANGESRTPHIALKSSSQRTSIKLMKPLEKGKTYTLSFDYKILNGSNPTNKIGFFPYFWPNNNGSNTTGYQDVDVFENQRNYHTFVCTQYSNEILLYGAPDNSEANANCYPLFEKVTLVEGVAPLEYEVNSAKKVVQMQYQSKANYLLLASQFYPVGANKELKVGDTVTLSVYVLIPEMARGKLLGTPYIEVCGYENVKQNKNASFDQLYIQPSEFQYNNWVRYELTTTIANSTSNGKTNFIRANLRYSVGSTPVDAKSVFYYALPQLEKNANATEWSNSKTDIFDSKRMASKIALNPQSIEMISRNLRINTDNVVIENTKGNFTMRNDELIVSNSDGSNLVKISSNGINIKKDGVDKMIDGLDTGTSGIYPFQPRFASYSKPTNTSAYAGLHVKEPNNSNFTAHYWYGLGERDVGIQEKTLVGLKKDCGRVNRYVYYHEKRYLKIQLYYRATGMTGFFHVTDQTGQKEFAVQRLDDNGKWNYVDIIADIGKPTHKFKNLELSIGATGGKTRATDGITFSILYMQLLNFNN